MPQDLLDVVHIGSILREIDGVVAAEVFHLNLGQSNFLPVELTRFRGHLILRPKLP